MNRENLPMRLYVYHYSPFQGQKIKALLPPWYLQLSVPIQSLQFVISWLSTLLCFFIYSFLSLLYSILHLSHAFYTWLPTSQHLPLYWFAVSIT
jgi:hypothetical protein